MNIDRSIYWNINKTLTYNALFNFIVGNRGGGKSYGAKKRCIDNFIKKGEQFGYIRRYRDDLKKPMEQFFQDIIWEYPDYEFCIQGENFYCREKTEEQKNGKKPPWTKEQICGYGFTLSTANNKKSISYPNITTIVFDEFLLEVGTQRYLSNEVEKLLNLYETVARPGSEHPRVVLIMLANAISITNPYFLYFNLKMPTKKNKQGIYIWRDKSGKLLVENVINDKFIDKKANTEFGQIIKGTRYADYSINNSFLLDDETFIEHKGQRAIYFFTFCYNNKDFGVWVDGNEGKLWVSENVDPYHGARYVFTLKDHKPNTTFIKAKKSCFHLRTFIDSYKNGCLYFENQNVKNITYEVLKMLIN